MSKSSIIGYIDPLIASPGDQVAVKVSCSKSSYSSTVSRLFAGYHHHDAPPVNHQRVESIHQRTHRGRLQFSRIGSFIRVPTWDDVYIETVDSLAIHFWCQPTLVEGLNHDQCLFSWGSDSDGFSCLMDQTNNVCLRGQGIAQDHGLRPSIKLLRHQWYHLEVFFNHSAGTIDLRVQSKARGIWESSVVFEKQYRLLEGHRIASPKVLTIASDSEGNRVADHALSSGSFNGKIDGFKVEAASGGRTEVLIDLDFSRDMATDQVRDISGHNRHGQLVNAPTRAVTSHDWDASQNDWTRAEYGYGAIHFHDDDLDDAEWDTDFEVQIPSDMKSGCYGVQVLADDSSDIIPFFVRPCQEVIQRPPVALIIPTFTYTAYGNERLHDESREVHFAARTLVQDKYFDILRDRPDLGISLYDSHSDGSGACFSSTKRAVVNMRPEYSMWAFGSPREFSADLWYVDFLERQLGPGGYDIITDHDISQNGADLLKRYNVLLSCSHPEYPTFGMLDSYKVFLEHGGHFMYLGGNGYYWVTAHDPSRMHRIEVRRADQGCRTFSLPPGNQHHSLSGEQGGLWRGRGRPPNELFGLGSCAMGVAKGAGYGITEEARSDPRLAFLFHGAGLETAKVIGDFGLVQGAASGDEIDRLDHGLGTPRNAVIIATTKLAGGHSDSYLLFNEETLFPMVNTTGSTSDKIRSDLIIFETSSGGAVFSVGSINWVGALAWKEYANNVAQITSNVLREFIRRGQSC